MFEKQVTGQIRRHIRPLSLRVSFGFGLQFSEAGGAGMTWMDRGDLLLMDGSPVLCFDR